MTKEQNMDNLTDEQKKELLEKYKGMVENYKNEILSNTFKHAISCINLKNLMNELSFQVNTEVIGEDSRKYQLHFSLVQIPEEKEEIYKRITKRNEELNKDYKILADRQLLIYEKRKLEEKEKELGKKVEEKLSSKEQEPIIGNEPIMDPGLEPVNTK